MPMQFTNTENPRWPQKVRVAWEMLTPQDDTSDRPDERDDGFYPSREDFPNEAEFDERMEEANDRMTAWEKDEWTFIGVVAKATIYIPIGGGSFRVMELHSAGLWGIESDSGDYLKEVFAEEKSNLLDELNTMAQALAGTDFIEA